MGLKIVTKLCPVSLKMENQDCVSFKTLLNKNNSYHYNIDYCVSSTKHFCSIIPLKLNPGVIIYI